MKNFIKILSILTIFFSSCQKEISIDNGTSPIPNLTDTILLRKFILFDPSLIAPNDTVSIVTYSYDNLKRCTKIIANDLSGNFNYTDFSYSNLDTLIKTLKTYSSNSTDSAKEFFSYNTSGKMITDSLVEYSGTTITETYNYDFSLLSSTNFSYIRKNSQQYAKIKHIIQNDLNENIISERDTSFIFNSTNNNYDVSLTNFQTISYDTKKCPFYKFSPVFPVGFIIEGGNISGSQSIYFGLSKHRNNIINEKITILTPTSGFAEYDDDYQYIYNSSNYPISVTITDNTQNKIWKGKYFY